MKWNVMLTPLVAKDDPLYRQAIAKAGAPLPTDNLYLDPRHQWAVTQAQAEYGISNPSSPGVSTGSNPMITQLYGHADHNDSERVANSGVPPEAGPIFIEDQPNIEGLVGRLPGPEVTKFLEGKGDFGDSRFDFKAPKFLKSRRWRHGNRRRFAITGDTATRRAA